jgi:hypothetical protein
MNRLAIFVEGQTERLFVEKLLEEVAGQGRLHIEIERASGGRKYQRTFSFVKVSGAESGQGYFVLVVDCGADNRVASDIRDRYKNLAARGYSAIIGIRDVHPVPRDDMSKLRHGLHWLMPKDPIEVLFVLGVMEIETWFIAEHTHFTRISDALTIQCIKATLGFDPSVHDIQLRDQPSEDLDKIYRLVGLDYDKSRASVQKTVDALDYARIYLELGNKINDLQALIGSVDVFLSGYK